MDGWGTRRCQSEGEGNDAFVGTDWRIGVILISKLDQRILFVFKDVVIYYARSFLSLAARYMSGGNEGGLVDR